MKKNIWIINHYAIPPSLGGLNRHYYFKRILKNRGYNVEIFSSSQIHNSNVNMISDKSFMKKVNVDGVDYNYIRTTKYSGNGLSRINNMLGFASKIKKIPKKFDGEKPDVIYASSPDIFTAHSAIKLAKKLKVPCIVEIRDLWPESVVEYKNMSRKNPLIRILYNMEKKIYKRADKLIFTMAGGKDYILDKGWDKQVSLDKIVNINNGVDLEEYNRNLKNVVIDDSDLNSDKFKVVYCGSIRMANNIGILVDVAKKFGNDSGIQFLMYGDGTDLEKLKEKCERENISNVVFKGYVNKNDIPYILSKSDLNILNYKKASTWKYGGSQNKMFEYMASGKPILSTIKMGYSLLEKYNCGVEIDEQGVDDIYNAIKSIKDMDKEEYNKMCINAKEGVKDFDFNCLADALIEVIESI